MPLGLGLQLGLSKYGIIYGEEILEGSLLLEDASLFLLEDGTELLF